MEITCKLEKELTKYVNNTFKATYNIHIAVPFKI